MNKLLTTILAIIIFSIIFGLFGGGILIPLIIIIGFVLYFNSNKKEKNKKTKSEGKNKSVWYKAWWGVLLIIFIAIMVIAMIVGLSVSESPSNTTPQSNINVNIEPITMTIEKIPITLSNLYPIRVAINNPQNKSIYPKFDIVVKDSLGKTVCDGSSLTDDFGTIYSNTTKTGEITVLGCMFNEDGDYNLTVTLIDSSYNKLAETSKMFTVNYWGSFGIDNSTTSNSSKIYAAELEIKNVPITLANLYPVRVTVNNKGDAFVPKLDYEVTKGKDVVCNGTGSASDIYELDANKETTFEIIFMGCMFTEDGDYEIEIELLSPDYNILDTDTKEFEVNYWSQFEIN